MINRYFIERTETPFVEYCSDYGELLPQNEKGDLVVAIRDVEGNRGYEQGKTLPFHTDCGTDYLIIRRARGTGGNRLVDCYHIYNALPRSQKEVLESFFPYRWGEFPVFVRRGTKLFCRYLRGYINEKKCSKHQIDALNIFDVLANKFSFSLDLTPGDTCVINNARMLHSREQASNERASLRAWVAAPCSENPFRNRFE